MLWGGVYFLATQKATTSHCHVSKRRACELLSLLRDNKTFISTHSCCFLILRKKCSLPFLVKGFGRDNGSRELRSFDTEGMPLNPYGGRAGGAGLDPSGAGQGSSLEKLI